MDYTGRSWAIALPAGTPLLTQNQRRHHMATYRGVQELQQAARWLIRKERIPHLERAHITYYIQVPDRRRRDPANWMDTAKAVVDALIKEEVLVDDDFGHVTGPDPRLVIEPGKGVRFVLVVQELA